MAQEDLSLFRSQPMEYVTMTFPREAAYGVVKKLGELEKLQFTDVRLPPLDPRRPAVVASAAAAAPPPGSCAAPLESRHCGRGSGARQQRLQRASTWPLEGG